MTPEFSPFGVLTNSQGCKTFTSNSNLKAAFHSSSEECVEYVYDGERLLTLKHINAGFNCCPGEIGADISITGNIISLEEWEKEQGCFCRCLYDLDYKILELKPGEYIIKIRGPYVDDEIEIKEIRFKVRLFDPCSGTFCVDRTHYPWGGNE